MNLHSIVSGNVGAVNQHVPLTVRVSTGPAQNASYETVPGFATPGAYVASFAGDLMTVSSVGEGKLQAGQSVAGTGVLPLTVITEQVSGAAGGLGVYRLNRAQDDLTDVDVTTAFTLMGQVQPMGWKDLQQTDALNLQGTMRKVYLYGQVEAIVRPDNKGGDLITDPSGRVWLVSNVLEDWTYSGWCAVVATLQNGA